MRRGRVDETKAAADELTKKVDAVAKGGDDRGLGEGFGGVGDPKIGAEDRDEALDDDPLGPKTMKQLVARQPRRGATATKTGGEAPNRRGRRTRPRTAPRRGRRGSLDFFLYALRARGRKRGQCRPRRRGRHLHGSPVRAQKPADGESESFRNLKATNYKKEPDQGQTNTPHPCVLD